MNISVCENYLPYCVWSSYILTECSPSTNVFVCVEVLRPSQPNGVMASAVSLPNHTLLGRLSPLSG